jgi:hypothetical protein
MAVKIQVEFFCVVTLCSVAVGYQRFGGPCCFHFQGEDLELNVIFLLILFMRFIKNNIFNARNF